MKLSIIIPTYNGGELFSDLMSAISKQSMKPVEVIVIDSSSLDNTRVIAEKNGARVVKIEKKDFSHGGTRNYGASIAIGDKIVFVTQDAIPSDEKWLENLISPFTDPKVVATFSRQIARNNAVPMEKFFYSQMYPSKSHHLTEKNIMFQGILFSNASSAVRKSFIMNNPFAEDILMSEDLEWARRVLKNGSVIAYQASSRVTHSHNTSVGTLFRRYFDFGVSHQEIQMKQDSISYIGKGFAAAIAEIMFLYKQGDTTWIPKSLIYNGTKFVGLALGKSHRILPRSLKLHFTSFYKEYWS